MKQITSRKSPLTFSDKEVSETAIAEILQNASWASSSYNNQPWYFISVFRKEKKVFQAVLDTLVPANQEWAGSASCFIVNLATSRYSNGKENKFYTYELGMAVANYVTLAMDKGIYCHQMAGFSKDKLEKVIKIPAEY
ncbi:MAG: hypothetical protein C0594_05310 [Marinilabiliales bacterium]|nr:MAG: hypothetical protein C0594_05310 [Marinilabiliales bacterium]